LEHLVESVGEILDGLVGEPSRGRGGLDGGRETARARVSFGRHERCGILPARLQNFGAGL